MRDIIAADLAPWHSTAEFINDAGQGILFIFLPLLILAVWWANRNGGDK
jgi:hypothetical protein